jgi:hypothetical protein
MKVAACIARCLVGASLLCASALVLAGPVYLYTDAMYGDTVSPIDINDHGVIVYTGFFGGGIGSRVGWESVPGYSTAPPLSFVYVTDINNAGDMYGTAERADGMLVPTIWLDFVPYDLTDPANAGMAFNQDPGPKSTAEFDLWSLNVVGLPPYFDPAEPYPWVSTWALTNARGDFVFEYRAGIFPSNGILTRVLPVPGTLALALCALAAMGAVVGRGKRVSR